MNSNERSKAVVLIPAYKPDERLIDLTRELIENDLRVMLVDDGGKETFRPIFEACEALGAKVVRREHAALRQNTQFWIINRNCSRCLNRKAGPGV